MSDMGLHGSIYSQLRTYSDKIDGLVVSVRSPNSSNRQSAQKELATLLKQLSAPEHETNAIRLVRYVLQDEFGIGNYEKTLFDMAESLERGELNENNLERLERMASVLDRECSQTLARMRGAP